MPGGDGVAIRRVACMLHYLTLLLPLTMSMVSIVDSGVRRQPVYWNSSNLMFHGTGGENVVEVNLGDSLDIICPHYLDPTTPSMEYYIVYMVNETNYNECLINAINEKKKILNCSRPTSPNANYITVLVRDFQVVPGLPDFKEGESYYFISTSGGQEKELDNQWHGSCYDNKMRMILRVVPPENSPQATTTKRPASTTGSWGAGSGVAETERTTTTTTSTSTTTSTTSRPTLTSKTTTVFSFSKVTPTDPGQGHTGGQVANDNVIHDMGTKNEGTITDSGAHPRPPAPGLLLLLLSPVALALWTR